MVNVAIDKKDYDLLKAVAKANGMHYEASIISALIEEALPTVARRHGWTLDVEMEEEVEER